MHVSFASSRIQQNAWLSRASRIASSIMARSGSAGASDIMAGQYHCRRYLVIVEHPTASEPSTATCSLRIPRVESSFLARNRQSDRWFVMLDVTILRHFWFFRDRSQFLSMYEQTGKNHLACDRWQCIAYARLYWVWSRVQCVGWCSTWVERRLKMCKQRWFNIDDGWFRY
jgi:hypothetical protein